MNKLYNSRSQITSELSNFIKKVYPDISKPHLKIIPSIILGIIKSESVVTTDIIKSIKSEFGDSFFVMQFFIVVNIIKINIVLT